MFLDQDSDPPLDFPDSSMLSIDDLDTFSSLDIEIIQEDQEDILSAKISAPMLAEQLPIMEEQEKPLKSGVAKTGRQVSIAKLKTEIGQEEEITIKGRTSMEASGSDVKRGWGWPQKTKDTLLTIEVVQCLDAFVYVNLGMPSKLVRGCTHKGDKLEPQKPKQYGPFTLIANMSWTRFLTEVSATVDIKLENPDLTEMTWCFQKKAQLMLTRIGDYKAMIQQILALKDSSAAIIIVSLPAPKCAHTKGGQKYQQDRDKDFEELNQLDEDTK
ncbi:hypothetical protein C0992_001618 [Termitomyces sp. T32_za158]|nr:hypothetical protein C0992_001618 [Termitomyces sp. T32_za158]